MDTIVLILVLVVLLYVSYMDITKRIIPNVITHPLFILLLIMRMIEGNVHLFWGLLPAGCGLLLFFIHSDWLGAGDVKLLAIIGLLFPMDMLMILWWMCASILLFRLIRPSLIRLPLAPFMSVAVMMTLMVKGLIG